MDAVEAAKSGHPGMPMAMAPAAYLLYTRYLRHNPNDPTWPDCDRFVLSDGHGSMLLYSVLHLCGYDVALHEIKRATPLDFVLGQPRTELAAAGFELLGAGVGLPVHGMVAPAVAA
jgi:transketolase